MAIKQFALPLNSSSLQTGDFTFKELYEAAKPVVFKLTDVTSGGGGTDKLNLRTKKNGAEKDHEYAAVVQAGKGYVTLSESDVAAVYSDANGGDWDYVEAKWTFGSVNDPATSVNYQIQNGVEGDTNGWPPKTS